MQQLTTTESTLQIYPFYSIPLEDLIYDSENLQVFRFGDLFFNLKKKKKMRFILFWTFEKDYHSFSSEGNSK